MTPKIFVAAGGQRDNVGDTALRRAYLDTLRCAGELHITLGSAPETYRHGLSLRSNDVVYPSRQSWLSAAYKEASRGPIVYAFHVGEMSLTTKLAISYAKQLPLVALARTRGGAAIHCGLGIRGGLQGGSADKVRVQVVKSILVACACVTWRDETSAHVMGIGAVEPDWAFGARDLRQGVDADLDRRTVAVALRHDRDRPSDEFVNAVQKYASDRGLEIVLTAQTERDLRPARENAARFGGRAIEWTDSALGVAEDNLRATYRGCHTVISNRLHGLVIAATEGATPIGLTTGDPEKLARTLDSAGLLGVCFDTRNAPEQDILSHLNAVDSKSADIRIAVKQAQSRLAQHADDLVELISSNAGGKPTASDRGR